MPELHAWWDVEGDAYRGYIAVGEVKVWRSTQTYADSKIAERAASETMARGLADLFKRFEVIPS